MTLYPATIMGRTIAVMLAGIALVAGILLSQLYWERQALLTGIGGWNVVTRIAGVVQVMEQTPAAHRPQALTPYQGPGFSVTWSRESPLADTSLKWQGRLIFDALQSQIAPITRDDVRIGTGEFVRRSPMRAAPGMGRMMHGADGPGRKAMIVSVRLTEIGRAHV